MNPLVPEPASEAMKPETATLTHRTTRAAQWGLAASAVGVILQLMVGAVLSRLLTPGDFGMMALAFAVLGLAQPLVDLGLGNALVQRTAMTDRHVRAAFTVSLCFGLVIAGIIALAAPALAVMMHNPAVVPVLRALSIGFVLGGSAVASRALLRRRMDFKSQFFIDTGSYILGYGVVAIGLALLGWGVWSLVWGGLFQSFVVSIASWTFSRHALRPLLAKKETGELLQFGAGASVSALVNYIALNVDNVIVGRNLGTASLGLYSRSYALMNVPYTYSSRVLSGVLFPAFAQVQAEPERLGRAYLLSTELTAMVAAPAMGLLAVAAPHLVRSLYGPQWAGAVVPLQILCLVGYFRALYHLGGVVAQSVGRVYSELWRQVIYALLVIVGALIGTRYGLPGVAAGVGIAILFMFVAKGQLALNVTGLGWSRYLRVQGGAILTAGVTCAVALAMRLVLEGQDARNAVITLAILSAAAVPWGIGLLWLLGSPGFESLRAQLPPWCAECAAMLRRILPAGQKI